MRDEQLVELLKSEQTKEKMNNSYNSPFIIFSMFFCVLIVIYLYPFHLNFFLNFFWRFKWQSILIYLILAELIRSLRI